MAGITDGKFALKLIPYGFNAVSIGGYNTDQPTIKAGHKIIERGRSEFGILEDELIGTIENEVAIIKSRYPQIKISANLRATSTDPIVEISKIKDLDIVEINCHCRQKELLDIKCGQEMLSDCEKLYNFVKEVVKKVNKKTKVSVKIRASVTGIDTLFISKTIEKAGADYLHIDAMNPGIDNADLELISNIATKTNIFIIGNNSINSIERGQNMLNAGCSGISVGRAAIGEKLNFDLFKI